MVRLDESNTNPAYLCGRLLAVLERTQQIALKSVKATLPVTKTRLIGTILS